MTEEENNNEPFVFRLLGLCLEEEQSGSSSPDGLSDSELFSTFAHIICVCAILALTLGPFSLLR